MAHAARVYIGLGSNLDDPIAQLRSAVHTLKNTPQVIVVACSPLYRSVPVGPIAQPDFVNAVAALDTSLSVRILLEGLQHIERDHGRQRTGLRWGPRTLDLDLLLYGDLLFQDATLTVPHPEMHRREFVLRPLCDIAPEVVIPGVGAASEWLGVCTPNQLVRIAPPVF